MGRVRHLPQKIINNVRHPPRKITNNERKSSATLVVYGDRQEGTVGMNIQSYI